MKRIFLIAALLSGVAVMSWAQAPNTPPPPAPDGAPASMPARPGTVPTVHPLALSPVNAVRVPPVQLLARYQDELNLSEEQNTKVRAAMNKYEKNIQPIMEKAQEQVKALQDLVNAASFDATKVKEAAAKAQKAEESVIAASIDFWAEFRGILTAEQNQKWNDLMARANSRTFGPGGNRPRPPMGPPGGPPMPNRPQAPAEKTQ